MTPLESEIRARIATDGPITVAEYMALCLGHPAHGYYVTRDPFGAAGDFVTAPEISQMFGELIGLWAAALWQHMGRPSRVRLVELGPGRGTLMADMLRAAKVLAPFRAALAVHLVEVSPVLRRRQQEMLADSGVACAWHADLAEVPEGPAIVVANEFFDALPVHQAVRALGGWHERMVGIGADGRLTFAVHPDPLPGFASMVPPRARVAPMGAVYEWRSDRLAQDLAGRVARDGGAALAIDYGHVESGPGQTLQAVAGHAYVDPLAAPGEADLTAHVDFPVLARAAERAGARVHGPITQGELLRRLGIAERAQQLRQVADPDQAAGIDAALARLTGTGRDQMGALFKAIVLADPRLGDVPGFEA